MNAPQPQFGASFPQQTQFQQQNGGNTRQGTQSNQFHGDQRGAQTLPTLRSQSNINSRRLVQWEFKKGDVSTWLKVEPIQHCLSSDILQHELSKYNRDNVSVQDKLRSMGKNARTRVRQLVDEQNESLWRNNTDLEWKIVGINLKWHHNQRVTIMGHHKDILKSIEVIMETEYRPFYQGIRAQPGLHMNNSNMPNTNFQSQNLPFRPPGTNNQQDHGQRPIQVFDFQDSDDDDDFDFPPQGLRNNDRPSFQQGPNQQFNQPHQNSSGPKFPQGPQVGPQVGPHNLPHNLPHGQHGPNQGHHGPSNGPSNGPADIHIIPPPPGMQGKGQQGMPKQDFRPEFIPPPPFNGPPQQPHFPPQNQAPHVLPPPPGANGQAFNGLGHNAGIRHDQPRFPQPETTNPQVLKSQKARSRTLPGGFPIDIDSDTEIEIDGGSGSDAVSAVSIDDEVIIRGRSRNSIRRPSNAREENMFRNQSIGGPKPFKSAMSPRSSGHNLPMPPLGKHNGNFVNLPSAKPVNNIPQQIHIHMSDRTRSKSSERSHHSHRERERRREKNHDHHHEDRERRHRRSNHYTSPSSSPRDSYHMDGKFRAPPMSRGSSLSSQSDYMSGDDSASSYSSVPTTAFSGSSKSSYSRGHHGHKQSSFNEKMPFHRRGSMRGSQDQFLHQERLHNERRGSLHNDYPHKQHTPVQVHHAGMDDRFYVSPASSEAAFPHRPHHPGRRHSMQTQPPNPFNTNQYPSARQPYSKNPGYISEEPNEININVNLEGLKTKKAQQHMQASHRPHVHRASTFGGGRPYDAGEDEWANPTYRM